MAKENNTFGEYEFPVWVPERTRESIRDFWGCFGRTYQDWLNDPLSQGLRNFCHHGPGPNGFGLPPNGATCTYFLFLRDSQNYRALTGKYIHRWNNMGSLIDKDGNDHTVSTCDYWVRIFTSGEEKKLTTKL